MCNLSRAWPVPFLGLLIGLLVVNPVFAAEKIDINTALLEDLVKIIHIGEKRAEELISLRPFSSLDELVKIKGISETRVKDIKEQDLAWIRDEEKEVSELITYSGGVVINELLPSPEGPDDEEEWIEVFNQNSFEINLSEWQIADTIGTAKIYTFPEKTTIKAEGFLVLFRPDTKITLNNSGDELKIVRTDGKVIDAVSYKGAPRGKSYNRTKSGWTWSGTLTPGLNNIISFLAPQAKETEPSKNIEEDPLEKDASKNFQKELAAIGMQTPEKPTGFPFGIALGTAFLSGMTILLLKNRAKKIYNKTI